MVYRKCLKLHNSFPQRMKLIGNAYIKDEFKRHHDPDNEDFKAEQYTLFLQEW